MSASADTAPTRTTSGLGTWAMLAVFIVACFAAAGIGSAWTTPSLEPWYAGLAKPSWNPPNWIFGPVWTTLYVLMAIAGWLAWRAGPPPSAALTWTAYFGQLALNTLWSIVFFGFRQPGWAFAEIVLLWLAIVATIVVFHRRSRIAAWLMAPYLAWVSFAAVLNFTIWRLNS